MGDDGNSPWFDAVQDEIQFGDLVLLVTTDQKRYLISMAPRNKLHTHHGVYAHDDLVGVPWGSVVKSQLGQEALLLEPSLGDLMKRVKRGTQIIYPKDAAYLVHRLNLRAGSRVIEAGTGSGALTIALAWAVAPSGRVFTYEARDENFKLARRNLERMALLPYVTMRQRSIRVGFSESGVDALFLDVREPWAYLEETQAALRSGGFFASLVPTVNQVSQLLTALERHAFADIAVEELLLRRYKPVPERLRPEDEMVAHTGYLIFARSIEGQLNPAHWQTKERRRYQARQQAEAEIAAREEAQREENEASGRKYPPLPLPG